MTVRLATPQARFAAFALVGIVLPAGILAVLGYHSLRQWEASADLLFREQAREMAAMAAEKVEAALRRAEDEILARIHPLVAESRLDPDALRDLQAGAPLIRRLYLTDPQGRLIFPPSAADADADQLAVLRAETAQGFWVQGSRRRVLAGDQILLAAAFKTAAGGLVCAAFSLDSEVVRREVLAKALGTLEGPTIPAVLDRQGRQVYTRGPVEGHAPIVTAPIGRDLPAWQVALYTAPGASPQGAVRRQKTLFTAAFGLLLLVIGAALAVNYRLVRRETEMARLKADFVANVSHDLKTPLALIRMFGETLEMGRVGDEASRVEYYRVITRESERLSRLINNVLDFSRIEGGRRRYDMAPTEIEPLVRETLEAFGYLLAQQGFKVDAVVAPDLPEVPLDAAAVGQALGNLVDNAIKYSGDRKVIRVAAALQGGRLALAVADEGIGIPAGEQDRIFEKFYRVGRSETQGRRGSGMGLALVRHIMEAHGGEIALESQPGSGSRFTLLFPLEQPAHPHSPYPGRERA